MNKTIKQLQLVFALIAIMVCGRAYAQPKPWSFGENVMISPNLYTGTMQLAIPFYTYKDADFEIPVSFGYASSGCMANVRGGIMGPGWGVNVGGMITREIRGIKDESGDTTKNVYGFYELHKNGSQQSLNTMLYNLFRVFGFMTSRNIADDPNYLAPTIVYSPNSAIRYDPKPNNIFLYDAEPDIFHFNFMGYSGSFHLGFNDSIHIYNTNVNSKDLKIEIISTVSRHGSSRFVSITIHTPDGYKYVFTCTPQSTSVVYSENDVSNVRRRISDNEESIAYNLVKIIAPNGRNINFEYERKKILSYSPALFYSSGSYYSHIYGRIIPADISIITDVSNKLINDKEHYFCENVIYIPILKKITVNSIDNTPATEIIFNYVNQSLLGKEQYRAFESTLQDINDQSVNLSSIVVNSKLDNTTTQVKSCNLSYMNNYNGARTTYLKDITIQGDGVYAMKYYDWDYSYPYPANGTFSVDHWGYYNGKNNTNDTIKPFLNITDLDANLNETPNVGYVNRNHDASYARCGMLYQLLCSTGGRYIFEYESHDYSNIVKRTSATNFTPQLTYTAATTCGGLRIKTIKSYVDANSSSLVLAKTYTYKNSNGTSSGILLNEPRYRLTYSASLTNSNITDNMTFRSDNLNEFNNIHIEYANVRETLNDGSEIRYNFTNSSMSGYMDTVAYNYLPEKVYHSGSYKTWSTNQNHSILCNIMAPVVSKQFIRGQLLKTETFNNSSSISPINTTINAYYNEYKNSFTMIPHYFVRALGYMPVYTGKFNPHSTTQTQNLNGVNVSTTTNCTYNAHGQVASQTSVDSRGITQIIEYQYVTDIATNPNGTQIEDIMAKYNVINLPLKEEIYVVENSVKTHIGGKRYTYFNPVPGKPAMIRLQKVETYDSEAAGWITTAKVTAYDDYGNLLEAEDVNGIKTCYIYGYNGLYKIAEISNCSLAQVKIVSGLSGIQSAPLSGTLTSPMETSLRAISGAEVTTFEYLPLVGLSKIKDSTGKSLTYIYNSHGKLEKVINTAGESEIRYNYSTDKN